MAAMKHAFVERFHLMREHLVVDICTRVACYFMYLAIVQPILLLSQARGYFLFIRWCSIALQLCITSCCPHEDASQRGHLWTAQTVVYKIKYHLQWM
jgi:hypothetical protein